MKKFLFLLTTVLSLPAVAQYHFQTSFNNADPAPASPMMMRATAPDWRGGFYCISEAMGSPDPGGAFIRLAPDGSVISSRFITGSNNPNLGGVEVTGNNQILIAGNAQATYGYNVPLFMRTDSLGNAQWMKTFEPISFQGQYYVQSTIAASDGGIIALYSKNLFNAPVGTTTGFSHLIKVSASGTLQWTKEFYSSTINNSPMKLVDLGGNEVMVIMQGNDINTGQYFAWIATITQGGVLIDQAQFPFDMFNPSPTVPSTYFLSGAKKANGNYLVGGNQWDGTNSKGFIAELNSSLDVVSVATLNSPGSEAVDPNHIFIESNGDVRFFSTSMNAAFGNNDGVFGTLDATLAFVDAIAFGDFRHNDLHDYGRTSDNGYFAAGQYFDPGNSIPTESFIGKFNSEGQSGCNESPFTITMGTGFLSLSPGAFAFNSVSLNSVNQTSSHYSINLNESNYCSTLNCDLQLSGSVTDVTCFNASTGAIDLTVSNANGALTYAWSGPSFSASTQDLATLAAGNYTVIVTDAQGCTATTSFTVNQPALLQSSAVATGPSCFGDNNGSINLSVSGGVPVYSVLWNGPSGFNSSLEDINGLIAGTYNVFISDANGCSASNSFVLTNPAALAVNITTQIPSCNGDADGSLTANASGGTAPYNYDWGSGNTSSVLSAQPAGNYTVSVSDANGCSTSASATLTQPAVLSATISVDAEPSCQNNDGSVTASVAGGTGPYLYSWSSGGNAISESALSEGNYTLDVSDANGCSATTTFSLNNSVAPVEICVISVDTSSQYNEIIWEKPTAHNLAGFNIYRLVGAAYQLIDFWPYDSLSQYTDSSAGINPNTTSYRYKISVVDSCGNESLQSDFHETIHLTVNPGSGGVMNLIWDNYEGLAFPYYRIGRFVNGSPTWNLIDSVTSSNTTYTDLNPPAGATVQYIIQVVLPQTCVSTRAINHNSTRSNRTANIAVGMDDHQWENSIVMYPNPASGRMNIESGTQSGTTRIEIINQIGEQVYTTNFSGHKTTLDLNAFANGVYFVRFTSGDRTITKKLVVQH